MPRISSRDQRFRVCSGHLLVFVNDVAAIDTGTICHKMKMVSLLPHFQSLLGSHLFLLKNHIPKKDVTSLNLPGIKGTCRNSFGLGIGGTNTKG